jgi:hypothetical protein
MDMRSCFLVKIFALTASFKCTPGCARNPAGSDAGQANAFIFQWIEETCGFEIFLKNTDEKGLERQDEAAPSALAYAFSRRRVVSEGG